MSGSYSKTHRYTSSESTPVIGAIAQSPTLARKSSTLFHKGKSPTFDPIIPNSISSPHSNGSLTVYNTEFLSPELLSNMETKALQGEGGILSVLPEAMAVIETLVMKCPDMSRDVWFNLKPILEESCKRGGLNPKRQLVPPVAEKRPETSVNVHGDEFKDDFSYFTNKDDPSVLKYLEEENRYADEALEHTNVLQKVLFNEFVTRIDENEESPRVTLTDGFTYYTRKIEGEEYAVHCRMDASGVEHVYLDENELVSSDRFFKLNLVRHSPDNQLIAYGVDFSGSERHTIYFKNKVTLETFDDVIEDVSEGIEFSNCGKYVFYLVLDDCERAYQLKRHLIGSPVKDDVVLYEEPDEMFFLTLIRSCNGKYLFINSSAQITSETRFIDCDNPLQGANIVFPRQPNVSYTVESHGNHFYILSNEGCKNNFMFRVPVPVDSNADKELAETVIEHRDFVLIEDFQLRSRHLITLERSNCLQNVRVMDISEDTFDQYHYISFSDLVYAVWLGTVPEESADLTKHSLFHTNILRYTFTSFVQPQQVIDYDMDTRVGTVIHEQCVLGYKENMDKYTQRRLFATGNDGTAIPLSIVYRKDLLYRDEQPNPCLLYGYGAYGSCIQPIFNSNRLSLLDRGFIYAVAHIRGGADMGNSWYFEGKLHKKMNTFNDFISAAEFLIKEGYTSKEQLAIYGRSAGGLLIGAVVNMRPDLFRAVLTEVPFVDALNTMFDTSIPWTAFEFEEWGNPSDLEIYNIMKEYCPYTNICAQEYPNMLVVAGMNDPRVAYFEPTKFVAKLRTLKTDSNLLLLKVDEVGHGGSAGQYSHLGELAYQYAFIISCLNAPYKPIVPHADQLYQQIEHEEYTRQYYLERNNALNLHPQPKAILPEGVTGKNKKKTKNQSEMGKVYQWISNLF